MLAHRHRVISGIHVYISRSALIFQALGTEYIMKELTSPSGNSNLISSWSPTAAFFSIIVVLRKSVCH